MRLFAVKESAAGVTLALLAFVLVFSSVPIQPVHAATSPIFSMTLLAPVTNPVRRQYAAIISNSYQQVGIATNLVYVTFTVLDQHLFPSSCPCGGNYASGGFDAAFIGWGGGAPIPDWRLLTHYHTEQSPPTGNYVYYHNTTVDGLIDQYQTTSSASQRSTLGKQIVAMVAQERPYAVIYYPADIFAFKNYISTWGQPASSAAAYTETDPGDYEHWTVGSGNAINVAVPGTLNDFNPLPSSTSNTIYNLYIYGALAASLQEYDPRTGGYDNNLASSITSTSNLLNWTISFHPTNWVDSAPVTADDFIFFYQSSLRNDGISINEGTYQGIAGLYSQFTYLNGTSHYALNGTYYEKAPTSIPSSLPQKPTSTFKAVSANSFTFSLPTAYIFTNPVLTSVIPLPVHQLGSIPESTWDTNTLVTGQTSTPQTITWDKSLYGGNGSYAYAYGFVSSGAYIYKGYDSVNQVATLAKNPNYWNASGLAAKGWFNAQTVHVSSIVSKPGAQAAFTSNTVNFMDTNYQLTPSDQSLAESSGGYTTKVVSASGGYQELGFNMNNPVWGTGTATPNGQKDPTHAARYARDVRAALSYLIPRDYIINNLFSSASPGITEMPPVFSDLYPSGLTEDTYSVSTAEQYLTLAGYSAGGAQPPPPSPLPTIPPITVGNITVNVPSFLVGNSITFSGAFAVDPTLGAQYGGFGITLQQLGTDNKTWSPIMMSTTNAGGYYSFTYTPTQTGTYYYRVFFTGVPLSVIQSDAVRDPAVLEGLTVTGSGKQNVAPTQTSAVAKYQIGSMADVVNSLATGISTQLKSLASGVSNSLNTVQNNLDARIQNSTTGAARQSDVSALTSQISSLNSQVSTLTTVAYAAIAVAVILGLAAIGLAMRKPRP